MAESDVTPELDAGPLWAAVDTMHRDAELDREWASVLGVSEEVQNAIVQRLQQRSAQWIGEHMDRLIDMT